MYDSRGTVILMGDFNAHFNGEKFIKPHDRRTNLFLQFLASNNLISINTLEMCTGAMSTYVSYSGEQYSMIDHILLPIEKYDLVTSCEILDDDALNVSNHRPICCHVNLSHAEETTMAAPSVRKSVQWRVAKPEDILNYRESVENQCVSKQMHSRSLDSAEAIDLYYNDVISIISSSSEKHLPYRKGFKQHLKPYWDDTLKDLHKSMRDLRRAWVLENRPKGDCYETYRVYKQAKRLFRQYHRKCADNHLKSLNEEIDRAAEVSSEYFWRLVNKRKNNNSGNVGCEIIFQDKTCRLGRNM